VRCTETPTSEELLRNPRARSARLRVVEKLAPAGVN
jgi:16S rRNA C1402 N4-methylase RsmH